MTTETPPAPGLPTVSVCVPAYNEQQLLPRLLASIHVAAARYDGQVEVVVADNNSTDNTADVANRAGARVVSVSRRSIAAARNGAAGAATGDVLAFVDADTQVHANTFNVIAEHLADGTSVGGCTGGLPERWSAGIAATLLLAVVPLRLAGVSTGVVFLTRRAFEGAGRFDESLRFAEDTMMQRAVRKWARQRGMSFDWWVPGALSTISCRKWDEHGDWHALGWLLRIARDVLLQRTVTAERYWYPSRRS